MLSILLAVDLSEIIKHYKTKRIPFKMLHKIMRETTKAIEDCHALGIVHCDIKPSNVLFSR